MLPWTGGAHSFGNLTVRAAHSLQRVACSGSGSACMSSDSIFDSAPGSDPPAESKHRVLGLTVLGLTSGALIGLVVAAAPFVAPALRRVSVYLPSHRVSTCFEGPLFSVLSSIRSCH